MAEYDLKTAIPEQKFTNIYSMRRPGLTDPGKLVVGDPYIRFEDQNKSYYTRNFNQFPFLILKILVMDGNGLKVIILLCH